MMKKYWVNLILSLCFISEANSVDLFITHGVINTTIGYVNLASVNVGGSSDTVFNFYNNELVDVLDSCGIFPPANAEFTIVSQTCGSWTGTQTPNPSSVALAVNGGSSCSVTIRYSPISSHRSNGNFQLFCQDSTYNGNTNPYFYVDLVGENNAPVISGSAVSSINEDELYSFTPTVSDVDAGDSYSFTISNKPNWATFDLTTGLLSGTPLNSDVGVHSNIIITVKDALGATDSLASFSITVNNTNDAPTISGTPAGSINEDAVYSFTPTVMDVDAGDSHSFSISNLPSWATLDPSSGLLSGTPTNSDIGVHSNIIMTVNDAAGTTDSLASFSITVTNTNDAPTISGTPSTSINEDALYNFTPTVSDVDGGDSYSFSISNKPNWATFDLTTGLLSGTPLNSGVGVHSNIIMTVTDLAGATDSLASFSITVTNTNDAPIISGTPAGSINEDAVYSFTPTVMDVDAGDSHSFSISNLPSWATLDPSSGLLSGTPTNSDIGVHSNIIMTVNDAAGATDSLASFSITVTNTNDAPTISGSPSSSINEDALYNFTPMVSDVDAGDSYSFTISNKPNWATFNLTTGLLSGTPLNSDVGVHSNIIMTVTDLAGATDNLASFSISVTNTNDAPTISGTPSTSINEDEVYSFTPTVMDVDAGDSHSFSISNLPSWATLDPSSGLLSGTPTNSDIGVHSNIIMTVNDAAGAIDSLASFSIIVTNTNDAPTISGTPAGSINEDALYSFTPTVSDVDGGDSYSFSISNKPNWATFDLTTGLLSGTPLNSDVGVHSNIIMTVTDLAGATNSLAGFSITVNNTNDAPIISGTPAGLINEDAVYSFTPTVMDVDAGDSHSFSISNLPSWATLDPSSGLLSGIPTNSDIGVHSNIIMTVNDAAGATDSLASFSITVTNTNDAPTISGTPSTSINEDAVYSFTPTVSDVDGGDSYSFSISNLPSWATFDLNSGLLSGTPLNSDVGVHSNIIMTVTDLAGATNSLASFSITVTNTNDAPIINADPQVFSINDKQEIMPFTQVLLSDDAEAISLSISFDVNNGILLGAELTANDGGYSISSQAVESVQSILQSLRFIPTENQVPAEQLVDTIFFITASDGTLASIVNNSIQISTISVNDIPVIYGQSLRVIEGRITEIEFLAEDLDNDEISFYQVASPHHGDLTINGQAGSYISHQGYYGADEFGIVANDGIDNSLPFIVDLRISAEDDDMMAVNDTIFLPINVVTNNYELDVLVNDSPANAPKLVGVLSLEGEASIKNNKVYLHLVNIKKPYCTLVYVIQDSRGRYAKAQVNLVFDV